MRKMISVLLLLPTLAAACAPATNGAPFQAGATNATATLSPPPTTDQTAATAPTLAPAVVAPGLPTATAAIKTEFAPTDPATVNLALGKPQLVEFFAFW